jgi:uncharacterized membrane protein (DUF4010 family)
MENIMITIIFELLLGLLGAIGLLLAVNDKSVLGGIASIAVISVSIFTLDTTLAIQHKTVKYLPIVAIERNNDKQTYISVDTNTKLPLDRILSTFSDEDIKSHLCIKEVIVVGQFITLTNSYISPISDREDR